MTTREHLSKHDREIAAIRKLILQGMKMIVEGKQEMREIRAAQRETDRQLKETDRQLKAFIESLRTGSNGHNKRRVV